MAPDQAAGLRRRARQHASAVHVFFDFPQSVVKLAEALHRCGQASLLVDMRGRVFADSSMRSLFHWRQQIQRQQLHTLPAGYGAGWHAPGIRASEPVLAGLAQRYDHVLLDEGPQSLELVLMPDTNTSVLLEVTVASLPHRYRLLKTLLSSSCSCRVGLMGDPEACDRLLAASTRFLAPGLLRGIYSAAYEDDAFNALAVRMSSGEAGWKTRYKDCYKTTAGMGDMALKNGC